jgi:DNA polymerase (family 10)
MALPREASEYWKEGKLREIPGVGKAFAEKIDELLTTGKLGFLEKLKKEIPPSLGGLAAGRRFGTEEDRAHLEDFGYHDSGGAGGGRERREAARPAWHGRQIRVSHSGRYRLAGAQVSQDSVGRAYPLALEIIETLKKVKGVVDAHPGGSLRRMRSTIGDIDILVAAKDSKPVMEAFVSLPRVVRVLGRGETKSSIEFTDGVRAQVWVHPPKEFGTAFLYATGSKEHNVRLREMALAKKLSLSDHSFLKQNGEGEIFCATEEEVYKILGLPWIPPELREDRGEIQAAKANKLPKLIEVKDIKADLQTHSTWSDGKLSMLEMARAAANAASK